MFERLLEPGCTESPACQCGGEMNIAAIETLPRSIPAWSTSARGRIRCSRRFAPTL